MLIFGLFSLAIGVLIHWFAWVFAWGRFQERKRPTGQPTLSYVFADLMVKIINDFRHFLALIIVLIFGFSLTYSLILATCEDGNRVNAITKAMQAVVSSLGGLIGAIIGYYFGEKAGEKAAAAQAQTQPMSVTGPATQTVPPPGVPTDPSVKPAPPPPRDNE